jgi:hypothetical protein
MSRHRRRCGLRTKNAAFPRREVRHQDHLVLWAKYGLGAHRRVYRRYRQNATEPTGWGALALRELRRNLRAELVQTKLTTTLAKARNNISLQPSL